MVDFFRDMSHGKLDLSGSKTFGWYTLDKSLSDYRAIFSEYPNLYADDPIPNNARRFLTEWPRAAWAAAEGDKEILNKFYGTVVVFNRPVDLFGGWKHAVCGDDNLKPSLLGQEMGHGYGLFHSKVSGSEEEYMDPWDIMSTEKATWDKQASHPTYGPHSIGPGLNAANMDGRGWLDYSRVREITPSTFETVELRPLHRTDLPGWIAISIKGIGRYFIEFRMNEGWDKEIGSPVVLVHSFGSNTSYIMQSTKGNFDLTEGGMFEINVKEEYGALHDPVNIHLEDFDVKDIDVIERKARLPTEPLSTPTSLKIQVVEIDVKEQIARISIEYRERSRPYRLIYTLPEGWKFESRPGGIPLTPLGLTQDTLIVNEKMISTPQWSLGPILKSLADICTSERFNNEDIRRTVLQNSLKTIIKIASTELIHMNDPGGVAPPSKSSEQSQQ